MGHPLLAEFCRAHTLTNQTFLRRCQRIFRQDIQPQLDRLEALEAENAALKAQLAASATEPARPRRSKLAAVDQVAS